MFCKLHGNKGRRILVKLMVSVGEFQCSWNMYLGLSHSKLLEHDLTPHLSSWNPLPTMAVADDTQCVLVERGILHPCGSWMSVLFPVSFRSGHAQGRGYGLARLLVDVLRLKLLYVIGKCSLILAGHCSEPCI